MAANRKLTGVLKGRTVTGVESLGTTSVVHFDDGSAMTVQTEAGTSAPTSSPPLMGRVRGVRQEGTALEIDFESGPTLALRTAEATASVIVRGGDHTLEYAD